MKRTVCIAAIVVTTLLYCSENKIAGGSGTETTNSFAYLENGAPAKNCKVFLIDSKKWLCQADSGSFIIDSTTARNDGSFTFECKDADKNRKLSLQIDHDISGLFRRNVSFGDLDGATFVLDKYSSIHGVIPGAQALTPVKIDGTTYSVVTAADGSFMFEKVPSGMYALFTQNGSGFLAVGSVKLPSDSLMTVAFQPKSAETFLITDFECGYKSPIAEAGGIELFWYLFSDSADKSYNYELSQWVDNTSADVIKTGKSSIKCLIGPDSKGSLSLQVNGDLDNECEFPYAGVGMVLYTEGDNGVDLQNADSLKVEAMGNGSVRIIFIAEHPTKKEDIRFFGVIDLNKSTSPIAVNLNSLKIDSGTPDSLRVSWEQACKRVRIVEFAFYGSDNATGSVFSAEIDNVIFIGNGVQKTLAK
jgi:hypothetical protein